MSRRLLAFIGYLACIVGANLALKQWGMVDVFGHMLPAGVWFAGASFTVHMGRVNSGRRWRYAERIGCDSVDGTFLRWPKANLPRLRSWINSSNQLEMFGASA